MRDGRLIVFARYPRPGKAKTRLIPALGPVGAARLSRRLTIETIARARAFAAGDAVLVEVHYRGGNRRLMSAWLGSDLVYRRQAGGDLGARMDRAFAGAFGAGAAAVMIIGTDCPGLTAVVLRRAWNALAGKDLVLGPARDGGYYLIGLHRPVPELFAEMPWSTGQLLARTLATAEDLGLRVAQLETLADVDRPEDLNGSIHGVE